MRYAEGSRYADDEFIAPRRGLTRTQVRRVQSELEESQVEQVSADQVTADQNNFLLPEGELVRLSTNASRTFTGFTPPRTGRFVILNSGANDLVIANNNAGSVAENRVLCHTGANITLNPNESVTIIYDFSSNRWRTVGFS